MDLGTYERMLDQNLSRQNFATSGQIYTTILERERARGVPRARRADDPPRHRRGEAPRAAALAMTGGPDGGPADVVFVEVGGTVGDYENGFYIEALRELAFEEGPGSICFVALTYVLEPTDPRRAEVEGGAARHQAPHGRGRAAAHHRLPGQAAGHRDRACRRSRCSRTCRWNVSSRCTTATRSTPSPRRCGPKGSTSRGALAP